MKQLLLTGLLFVFAATATHAQDDVIYSSSGKPLNKTQKNIKSDKLIDPNRLVFGGWGVFGIGTGFVNVGVTPILGYRITDNFLMGVGFGYQYLRIKDYNTVIVNPNNGAEEYRPLSANIYSPSVWARHIIWNNLFAHAEYEHNIMSQTTYTNDYTKYNTLPIIKDKQSVGVPSLLLGAGLRQPISARSSFVFMVLYDVLQDKRSPYFNTVAIRFGFNAGF